MAVIDTHRTPAALSVFADRLGARFTTGFRKLADLHDRAVTRRQLNALSDHQLEDIGLHRGAIDDMPHHWPHR